MEGPEDAVEEQSALACLARVEDVLRSYYLSPFSQKLVTAWLKEALEDQSGQLEHVRRWLCLRVGSRRQQAACLRKMISPFQLGCPEIIPGLRSMAVWDPALFPWARDLEEAFPVIKRELLALRGQQGFQQYRAPSWASKRPSPDGRGSLSHDAGDWNVYYLYLHIMDFAQNRARCPETCRVIESIPSHYHHAFFSALAPNTHVAKHHGPTNRKLRCHLPLVVPEGEGSTLRVGDDTITLEEGRCLIFDDSFDHEAWHRHPGKSRLCLIVDVWHPDLTPREVKFFSFLQRCTMRAEKRLCEAQRSQGQGEEQEQQPEEEERNFYALIEGGQARGGDTAGIWQGVL